MLTVLAFAFVIGVLVFVHELGHFLAARRVGIRVLAFSIGFGPRLIGFTRGGTEYKIAAIPLGGYVKFVGDLNAASVPDQEQLDRMPQEERSISFPHQNVAKRAAIVAAGPIANFILAIAIFAGFNYFNGRQVLEPRIEAVQPGSAAEKAGFQPKDLILTVDGRQIQTFADMQLIVSSSAGEPLEFTVERDGQTVFLTATPNFVERTSPLCSRRSSAA